MRKIFILLFAVLFAISVVTPAYASHHRTHDRITTGVGPPDQKFVFSMSPLVGADTWILGRMSARGAGYLEVSPPRTLVYPAMPVFAGFDYF